MSERNLVAACMRDRSAFEQVYPHLTEGDISEQSNIIVEHIRQYYDRDSEALSCDSEILARDVQRSMANPKHKETFATLVTQISEVEVSPANVVHDFVGVKREAVGAQLASALLAGRDSPEVLTLVSEYEKWANADSIADEETEILSGVSAVDLVRTNYTEENLIKVYPKALNDRLDGGCLRGHHIVIFARPEMGKTLMLVNMIFGFLRQGLRVLYVGNEDPLADIIMRVFSRLSGKTKYDVIEDPEGADTLARERGYNNIVFAGLTPGTPREIEKLIVDNEPDVVLIDQLRNLNVGEEQFVQKLEKAATAARNLGKRHNVLMVSVTQAGDSATGKAVLEMGDVDSSNTGIPAQADVMVGLSAAVDDEANNRRVISLPKNKRSGRHDYFTVGIDPTLSKVRSIE